MEKKSIEKFYKFALYALYAFIYSSAFIIAVASVFAVNSIKEKIYDSGNVDQKQSASCLVRQIRQSAIKHLPYKNAGLYETSNDREFAYVEFKPSHTIYVDVVLAPEVKMKGGFRYLQYSLKTKATFKRDVPDAVKNGYVAIAKAKAIMQLNQTCSLYSVICAAK